MSLEGADADLANLNYTVHVPYNGTIPTGGDSLTQDLNVFYEVCCSTHRLTRTCRKSNSQQSGDIAWLIAATALVLLMIPGVG